MAIKTITKRNSKAPMTSFKDLQKIYGLRTPEQIKLRIIWMHIQALTLQVHGNTPENVAKFKTYDRAFEMAELEENTKTGSK